MPPPEKRGNTEDKKARCPLGQNNEDGIFPNKLPFSWRWRRMSLLIDKDFQEVRKVTLNECTRTNLHK